MKKTHLFNLLFLLIGLCLGSLMLVLLLKQQIMAAAESDFHEHADFAVFIEGEAFDFSEFRYMSLEPCEVADGGIFSTAHAHGGSFDEHELSAAVHLHNNNGSVIHVHRPGVNYEDFFNALEMEFHDDAFRDADGRFFENNEQKTWRFMLNGKEVDTLASGPIRDLDKVLISYGDKDRSENQLRQEYGAVSNESCVFSESCLHRPPAPPEGCAQSPQPALLRILNL